MHLFVFVDILACEHEEAIRAAVEALTTLIESCIDDNLINQGVAQIKLRKQGVKSGPTAIEKICSTFEGLLGIQYSAVWDLSFQILSVAFDTIGTTLPISIFSHSIALMILPQGDGFFVVLFWWSFDQVYIVLFNCLISYKNVSLSLIM